MTDNETPEQTTAQLHYAAAEYALDMSKDVAGTPRADLIAQAQVHATLAQAASNEALLQFIGAHVTSAVLEGMKKHLLGGTTYHVEDSRTMDEFRRAQAREMRGGVR
ncbi:hypothetical protein SEA_HORUS_67 [Gordonia phage Horus]|uniref:Uncharacterized protein n=1 Tax=Gordonia phage Horus TaxID=2301696 RepID=A0A385DZK5_9CAUD|nr:hypothetical protein HOT93_gp083 [Gordonia phage Horus]AXQ63919.1 hypothetical protein SEA_HORUS_67 [Gordonia phage Horus]